MTRFAACLMLLACIAVPGMAQPDTDLNAQRTTVKSDLHKVAQDRLQAKTACSGLGKGSPACQSARTQLKSDQAVLHADQTKVTQMRHQRLDVQHRTPGSRRHR